MKIAEIGMASLAIVVVIAVFYALIGPARCSRNVNNWVADKYGSDFLVIQYAVDGKVLNYWELKDKSVGNEENSDGIFFVDNSGNVVHLSGLYMYVQVDDWEKVRAKYLEK